jgi:hypothetical protein
VTLGAGVLAKVAAEVVAGAGVFAWQADRTSEVNRIRQPNHLAGFLRKGIQSPLISLFHIQKTCGFLYMKK